MKKLKLKHLAGYLPYELEAFDYLSQRVKIIGLKNETYFIEGGNIYAYGDVQDCKPILHPLSDLTKEIEVNGEKFVPIVRLLGHENLKGHNFSFGYDHKKYYSKFMIESTNEWIYSYIPSDVLSMDYFTIQKLYEWHFDIHGLIPELAIDINTIKKPID